MREFNDFEKNIMQFMVNNHELQDVCTINLFFKFCNCYLIRWSDDYSSLEVIFKKNEKWVDVRNRIFDLVVLLEYLEKNSLIGVFQIGCLDNHQIFDSEHFVVKGDFPNITILEKKKNDIIHFNSSKLDMFNGGTMFIPKAIEGTREQSGIGKAIQKYADSTYHVTQTMKDYVANNFQTKEDIRYKQSRRQARVGIIVAIVTSVVSILIEIFGTLFQRLQ